MPRSPDKMKSAIFLAFVLIVATGYYFFAQQGTPTFRFSSERRTFAFYGSKNTSAQFSFDTLIDLELRDGESPAMGTAVDGGEVYGGYLYGIWQNSRLGEYEAFVSKRIDAYIIARDEEKTAIFNTGNAQMTKSLFEQLQAFWNGEL